jgi:predicted ABC-type transport system involved in lysophospholipase L1 biosynthesis ATPase subunit
MSQTSNREGSRATTLALMCASVAIVINKLSHLSDRVCNSCWRRKVRNLFQLFHLVKNSTKEESVQTPDRFVSNGN